ncbi:MAG: HTH domain-containing protein, partial [Anaerostipes sp.]|nr:HTH domain-containing protein [Anaerostipes sp.]
MTKRKTELTTRQKSIIRIITQFSHQNPVTVKAISEKLGLSSRTILREMPDIENWMALNDFNLVKKPRVGLYLDEEDEAKALILELIDLDKVKFQYSKKERKRLIVEDILSTEEPRKFFYFTSKYGISDRTLGSDLDELETWMASYGIELVRKPGFGVYWSGNEENYRQAVNSLIVELCGGRKLRSLLQEEKRDENQDPLLMPYDRESVASVEDILRETQERLKIQYTDNAFNGLLVYLMVSIQRMKEGKMVVSQGKQPDALLRYHERQEAARVANELEKVFNIKVSRAEIMFIAVQLISAKIWQPSLRTKYE